MIKPLAHERRKITKYFLKASLKYYILIERIWYGKKWK